MEEQGEFFSGAGWGVQVQGAVGVAANSGAFSLCRLCRADAELEVSGSKFNGEGNRSTGDEGGPSGCGVTRGDPGNDVEGPWEEWTTDSSPSPSRSEGITLAAAIWAASAAAWRASSASSSSDRGSGKASPSLAIWAVSLSCPC